MYVSGNASLYVTGSFSMGNIASITIAPPASLKLYIGNSSGAAASASLSLVNTSANASTFQLYGLPTLTALTWGGNASNTGIVYAPQAQVSLGSGGNITIDCQGAFLANSINVNGHFNFHFDENLKRSGPTR